MYLLIHIYIFICFIHLVCKDLGFFFIILFNLFVNLGDFTLISKRHVKREEIEDKVSRIL